MSASAFNLIANTLYRLNCEEKNITAQNNVFALHCCRDANSFLRQRIVAGPVFDVEFHNAQWIKRAIEKCVSCYDSIKQGQTLRDQWSSGVGVTHIDM